MPTHMTIKEAQDAVKEFSEGNGWEDIPNIDKFDHIHEELLEMSRHLRYKTEEERIAFVQENKDLFEKEMGDLLFAVCRLANQLDVNLENGFTATHEKVLKKYSGNKPEHNIVRENEPV
jgi:NTP pyrophosphatase (non-canonical NTP hydrolase)